MLRRHVALFALVVSCCTPAVAGTLQIVDVPTPGLPGYCTYFLSYDISEYERSQGEVFRGFDATFSGDIHQVNPFGLNTTFVDNNQLFQFASPGTSVLQDSQFLFSSGDVLSIGTEESDTLLTGVIVGLSSLDLPNPAPFAQVVTRYASDVSMSLQVDNGLDVESYDYFVANLGIPTINADIQITSEPAADLPGYRTYTLWLHSGGTAEGVLIDAQINGPIYQGSDSQSTVFRSETSEAQRAVDSHFYNDESRVLGRGAGLIGSEGSSNLSAILPLEGRTYGEWIETGAPFAQITTNDPTAVEYHLSITFCDIPGAPNEVILAGALARTQVPEPCSLLLAGLSCVAAFGHRTRRRAESGGSSRA